MKNWDSWESLGLALIMLWFFFTGYMAALCWVFGLAWSTWSVTLYFLNDGPMTGPLFVQLLNIARWAFIILTAAVVWYVAYSITLSALTQKEMQWMVEEYGGIREEDIDGMHDARPESHFDLTIDLAERIVKITEQQSRELQNVIDYIISRSHSIDEIIDYATNLKQRLGEK